jgi:hypothetical protein
MIRNGISGFDFSKIENFLMASLTIHQEISRYHSIQLMNIIKICLIQRCVLIIS